MRAAGEQAKTACRNLQLCAGLEAGIEGATHAIGQKRVDMVRDRKGEEESVAEEVTEESGDEGEEVVPGLAFDNLRIETEATQEGADRGLKVALRV